MHHDVPLYHQYYWGIHHDPICDPQITLDMNDRRLDKTPPILNWLNHRQPQQLVAILHLVGPSILDGSKTRRQITPRQIGLQTRLVILCTAGQDKVMPIIGIFRTSGIMAKYMGRGKGPHLAFRGLVEKTVIEGIISRKSAGARKIERKFGHECNVVVGRPAIIGRHQICQGGGNPRQPGRIEKEIITTGAYQMRRQRG